MCTLLTNKRYELLYNCGIQLLHIGRPLAAFECLIEAVQVYHANPRLWLRLAECCIAANKGVSAAWISFWTHTFPHPPLLYGKQKILGNIQDVIPFLTQGIYKNSLLFFNSLDKKNVGLSSHLLAFWSLVSMTTCISRHIKLKSRSQ